MSSPSFPEPASPVLLVEALEPRIAPAALIDPTIANSVVAVTVGTPQLLIANQAGQPSTLATSNAGGVYLLHVDAGAALVFTTDINGDGQFSPNEITGIALSDGARLTLFTDVNGDIATNLTPTGSGSFQLTDSDNDASNGRDGLLLLPSSIPNITLRSVTNADLNTSIPGETALNRVALSGYSIFGSIYVGGDFGVAGVGANHVGAVDGLVIDTTGAALQAAKFTGNVGIQFFPGLTTPPSVGAIKTGTATSFNHLSFGNSFGSDITGEFGAYAQAPNLHGGDISGIRSVGGAAFSVGTIATGDGGVGVGGAGARGGNITDVFLNGETGGYQVLAGNGGAGPSGGLGGTIGNFNDLGSVTSLALLHSGDGGRGTLGAGGLAGAVNLGTVATVANLRILLGDGGDGLSRGGDGAPQPVATIAPPESDVPLGVKVLSTTRDPYTFISALTGQPTTTPQPGDQLAMVLDPTTGQMVPVHAYDIGATRSVDFDGDGFSDAVYTSSTPDQLVLVFGKDPNAAVDPNAAPSQVNQTFGFAIDPAKTIFLDAPFNPQAVVIGDFNADGRPDVAAASGDAGSFGGISVYLNQIHDTLRNPTNVPSYTGNPNGDHPFSDALHSSIPVIGQAAAGFPTSDRNYLQSPVAVTNLVAGDFNGDGVMDLAYLGIYRPRLANAPGSTGVTVVIFGDTDSHHAYGNGYFYANPALPTDFPASRLQFARSSGAGAAVPPELIASSLVSDTIGSNSSLASNQPAPFGTFNVGQHDSIFLAVQGARAVSEFAVNLNQGGAVTFGGAIVLGPQAGGIAPSTALAHQPFGPGLTTELGADPNPDPTAPPDTSLAPRAASVSLGRVDTNRDLATGTSPNLSLVTVTLADYAVVDYNNDGRADIVGLSEQPAQFLIPITGDKTINGPVATTFGSYVFNRIPSPNPVALPVQQDAAAPFIGTQDNRGIKLSDSNNGRAIRPTDSATSTPSNLAVFTLGLLNTASVNEFAQNPAPIAPNPPSGTLNPGFVNFSAGVVLTANATAINNVPLGTFGADRTVISFDLFRSRSDQTLGDTGYESLSPNQGSIQGDFLDFSFRVGLTPRTDLLFTANGIEAHTGDGGSALSGVGGKGGLIGGTLSPNSLSPVGSVTITLPAYRAYQGEVTLRGGSGGDGFTGAGDGGDITGVIVRYSGAATVLSSDVQLIAGAGGFATGGTGGRGGDIAQVSIATGSLFQAGNGGAGLNGNRGGNITGNTAGLFDTTTTVVSALAGNGGIGRINGGLGGSVTGFHSQFLNIIGGIGGSLTYTGGTGGSGGGGTGGSGGDLLNDSPDRTQNALAGPIALTAGTGGDGLTGGRGGNVDNFVNAPSTQSSLPTSIAALAGNGGAGITGFGGAGGNLRNLNVAAVGLTAAVDFSAFGLNKAIAGVGGASFGLDGGAGGSITAATLTSTAQPFVASSGAGGAGLLSGGTGGTINTTTFNSAGTSQRFGKVLVIAGAGGDAAAVDVSDVNLPGDPIIPGRGPSLARQTIAVGGQAGVGGDGGSIVNFTQPLSTQVNVDLVGGNGGSIRYGNSITVTGNVGRGGSITNASVAGDIGSIGVEVVSNVSPPIRAYNDVDGNGTVDESLAQFVANTLRPQGTLLVSFNQNTVDPTVNAAGVPVAIGNVGIVAGVAGRVAAINGVPQPALGTPNGAVTNVTARNVMSIVAGSVDSVAPVDNVANLRVTSGERIFGADKSPTTPGLPGYRPTGTGNSVVEYLDLTGRVVTDLQPGDRLIDGAIYTFANTTGDLQQNPRVIVLSQG